MLQRLGFLLLLIVGLFIAVSLVLQRTSFFPKADISAKPENVLVTNISDNSFTVSWLTAKKTTGFISYGTSEQLGSSANDDRDESPQARFTHHATLKNLDPNLTYYFKIGSGAELFDYEGKPFVQKLTPTSSETPPTPQVLFGRVVKKDKSLPAEALIYTRINGGNLLSSFSRTDGDFSITLNNARTLDLQNYLTISSEDIVELSIRSDNGTLTKEIPVKNIDQAQELVLENVSEKVPSSTQDGDLNNDGVINVFDFAIKVKSLLGL